MTLFPIIIIMFSKSCQMANWDKHKKMCKETKKCFQPVKLDSPKYLGNKGEADKIFKVKAYCPGKSKDLFFPDTKDVVLYNEDGTLQSFVSKKCPNFKRLEKMVLEKGIWGIEAYCNAKWSKEEVLMIDMENVLPFQDW